MIPLREHDPAHDPVGPYNLPTVTAIPNPLESDGRG